MKQRYSTFWACCIGLLTSFAFAFLFNRYPFFWNDSETYIGYAVRNVVTTYGTTAYPVFLKLSLVLQSLWFPVIIQSLISSYLLWTFARLIYPKFTLWHFLGLQVLLLFSSYHFFVDTVMPDIFFPLGLLANFILLERKIAWKSIPLYIIFSFCVIAHNGFPYPFIAFNLFILPFIWFRSDQRKDVFQRWSLVFILALFSLFVWKPLLAKTYEKDIREKRNINFFCRQIILTKYEGMFKEVLEYGCKNVQSKVCGLEGNKKNIIGLKYNNKWEEDCKEIFLQALSQTEFRRPYLWSKTKSIGRMFSKLAKFKNSGSNPKQHDDIRKIIDADPFLPMENSLVDRDFDAYKTRVINWGRLVSGLFYVSLFGILFFLLFPIINKSETQKINIDPHLQRFLWMSFSFVVISLIFYGLFSRPHNGRYGMRFGWLVVMIFYMAILKYWNNRKNGPDSLEEKT